MSPPTTPEPPGQAGSAPDSKTRTTAGALGQWLVVLGIAFVAVALTLLGVEIYPRGSKGIYIWSEIGRLAHGPWLLVMGVLLMAVGFLCQVGAQTTFARKLQRYRVQLVSAFLVACVMGAAVFYWQFVRPRTWPGLLVTLKEAAAPRMRVGAARALSLYGDRRSQVVPALRQALFDDPDPRVREASAVALGIIGGPDAAEALQACEGETDGAVRRAVGEALGKIGAGVR